MDLTKFYYVFRSIGFGGIIRTLFNSIYRDVIEKRNFKDNIPYEIVLPGNLQKIIPISSGLSAEYSHAKVTIEFLTANMIRVTWEPGNLPVPYTIINTEWETQPTQIESDANSYILKCGKINVTLDDSGGLFVRESNSLIFHQDEPPFQIGDQWTLSTTLFPEEHIYGLGERASRLNLRPGKYSSWNTDVKGSYSTGTDPLYIGTPIYLSISQAGNRLVYFENSFKSKYSIGEKFSASFEGGALRYYIIFGSLDIIYKQLSQLVGFPFLPPRWTLGYHQCRWGYRTENDILGVIDGFEKNSLPISAIHLDIDYMDGFRVFSINTSRFPDFKGMTQKLAEKGIKVVASLNPAVKQDNDYKVFREGLEKGMFCKLPNGKYVGGVSWPGWSMFPDFSDQTIRAWWSDQYKFLIDSGVSGFWHDMNEPSSFSAWGDITLPDVTQHKLDGNNGDHREVHNLYGLLMNRAGFEGARKYSPDKRPWIFSRSGWAGSQRFAWNWIGDIDSSWNSLKQTIPTILGLSLSGHTFSGVDIGGFNGNPDAELYLRWFQLASFLPLFRTHSAIGTKPREPWVFGEDTTKIIRKFLELRYKLLPYLYTSVWKTCQTGVPFIRPLFWIDPADTHLWDIDDEFCLGEDLLVAPIVTEGASSRKITLPSGMWISFWDDHSYLGPSQFDLETSSSTIPLFIRGGTLLTLDEENSLNLHIYPVFNQVSENQFYRDSGDGYGEWRLDKYRSIPYHKSLDIIWETDGNFYFPYPEVKVIFHGEHIIRAIVDDQVIPINKNSIITPLFRKMTANFD